MCGVAGVFNFPNAENFVARILFSIQHRGQESCGISTRKDDCNILTYKNMGLVKNVLNPEILELYSGNISIGHVRYPTAGSSNQLNSQPHSIEMAQGAVMSICSNGDVINYNELRKMLEDEGFVFKSDNDAELIGRLVAYYFIFKKFSFEDAIAAAQESIKGAFSSIIIYRDAMYAFRDPHGFRPYSLGHLAYDGNGEIPSDGAVLASENCAFGTIGATFLRELEPGEIIKLETGKPLKVVAVNSKVKKHCVFELFYFSRPDSKTFDEYVYDVRKKAGAVLADYDNHLFDDDGNTVVVPVPDSSNFMALGYSHKSGIPLDLGLLRNHYVGRTFTKPNQQQRDEGVKEKFNPLPGFFDGKRVILVDDSIVRGTTLRKIVRMIKANGAKEIHVRIGSPEVIGTCYYGIDITTRHELIANTVESTDDIRDYLTADSLKYVKLEDFGKIFKNPENFCKACFNRDYIYPPEDYGKE